MVARSFRDCTDEELAAAVAAARTLLRSVAPVLDQLADQVWCFGMDTTARRRALGMVAQMAAELALGAESMFDAQRVYAGSSLVRQLIETDYLLFLFAQDPGEAERWIAGTPADHKKLLGKTRLGFRSGRPAAPGTQPGASARWLADAVAAWTRSTTPRRAPWWGRAKGGEVITRLRKRAGWQRR